MVPNEGVVSGGNSRHFHNNVSMYWVFREFFGSVEEAWIPDLEGIIDLQIKKGVLEPVPLQLEYPSGIIETWAD